MTNRTCGTYISDGIRKEIGELDLHIEADLLLDVPDQGLSNAVAIERFSLKCQRLNHARNLVQGFRPPTHKLCKAP